MKIIDGSFPPVSTSYSLNLRDVVHQLLQKDATARPSALQLLASPPLIRAASELEIALPQPAMELFQTQVMQAQLQDQGRAAAARQNQSMSRLAQPKRNSAPSPEQSPPTVTATAGGPSAAGAPVASVSNLHLALHPSSGGSHADTDAAGGPAVVDPLTGAAQASPLRGHKARLRGRGGSKVARGGVTSSPIKPLREGSASSSSRPSAITPRGGRVRIRGRGAAGSAVGRAETAGHRSRHRPLPPAAQQAAQKAAAAHGSAYRRRTHTAGRSGTGMTSTRAGMSRAAGRSTSGQGARSPEQTSPEGKQSEEGASTPVHAQYRGVARHSEALRGGARQSSTSAGARRITVQDVLQVSAARGAGHSDKASSTTESALSPRTSPVQMQGAFGDLSIAGAGLGGLSIDPAALAARDTPSRSSKRRSDIIEAQGQRPLAPLARRPATSSGGRGDGPGVEGPLKSHEGGQHLRNHNYPSDTAGNGEADGMAAPGESLEPTVTSMPLSARGFASTLAGPATEAQQGAEGKSEASLPPIRGTTRGGAMTPGPQALRHEVGGGSRSARSSFTGGTTGGIGAATAGPMPTVIQRGEAAHYNGKGGAAWRPSAGQAAARPGQGSSPDIRGPLEARPRQAWSDWSQLPGASPSVAATELRALDNTMTSAVHSTIQEVTEPLADDTPPQSGRGDLAHSQLEDSATSERSFLRSAHNGPADSSDSTWDSFDDSFLRHQAIAEASVGDSKTQEDAWPRVGVQAAELQDAKHLPQSAQREITPAEVEEDIMWGGSGGSSPGGGRTLGATGASAASHFMASTGNSHSGSQPYLPQLSLPVMQAPGPAAVQSARAAVPLPPDETPGGGGWSLEQHGYGRPTLRHAHSEPSSPRDIRAANPPLASSRMLVNAAAANKTGLLPAAPGTARVPEYSDDDDCADSVGSESLGSDSEGSIEGDSKLDDSRRHGAALPPDGLVSRRRDALKAGATNIMEEYPDCSAVRISGARPRQLDVPEHFLPVQSGRVESAPLTPLSDDDDGGDGGLPEDVPDVVVAQSAESDADAAHLSATAGASEAKAVRMSHPAVQAALAADTLLHAARGHLEELQCAAGELQYKLRLASVDAEDALDEGGVAAEEAQLCLEELQSHTDSAKRRVTGIAKWTQERSELHLRIQQLAAACGHIKAPTPSAAAMLRHLLGPAAAGGQGGDSASGPTSPGTGSADDVDALLSQLTGEQQMLLFKLQFFHGKLRDSTAAYHVRFANSALSP